MRNAFVNGPVSVAGCVHENVEEGSNFLFFTKCSSVHQILPALYIWSLENARCYLHFMLSLPKGSDFHSLVFSFHLSFGIFDNLIE